MHPRRRELLSLQERVAARRAELAALEQQQAEILQRLAAVRLAWLVCDECKAALGPKTFGQAGSCDACAPPRPRQRRRLPAPGAPGQPSALQALRLDAIEALGYGFGGCAFGTGGACGACCGSGACGGAAASACSLRGATPPNSNASSGTAFSLGCAAGRGAGGGGRGAQARWQMIRPGPAGGRSCGGAPVLLPHLGPGAPLPQLDGAEGSHLESVRVIDIGALRAVWSALVGEAVGATAQLAAAPRGAARAASAARLRGAGMRLKQLHSLLVLGAFDAWAQLSTQHMESREPACGERDAPLAHWERAVRALRLTRGQAQLLMDSHQMAQSRLAELEAERRHLTACLASGGGGSRACLTVSGGGCSWALAEGGALGRPGPFTAALLGGAPWRPPRGLAELVAALGANLRGMRAALALSALLSCAVMTPEQWAQYVALSYPWPPHAAQCVSVLTHDLRFRPEAFEHAARGPTSQAARRAQL